MVGSRLRGPGTARDSDLVSVTLGENGDRSASTLGEVAARLLADHAPVIIGHVGVDERVVDLEGALLDAVGYPAAHAIGRPISELMEDGAILSYVRRGLAGEQLVETAYLNHRSWTVACTPERGPNLEITGVVVLLTFADQVEIRAELRDATFDVSKFEALVAGSTDFIGMADPATGELSYLNPAGAAMIGAAPGEDLCGTLIADLLPEEDRDLGREMLRTVTETGRWSGESALRHLRTGERIPVSTTVFLVEGPTDSGGKVLATVQRDVRSRVRNQEALAQRALEQRMAADFARLALTLPLPQLLQEAVDLIGVRFTDMMCAVLRPTADGRRIQLLAATEKSWQAAAMPMRQDTVVAKVLQDNERQVSEDVVLDDRYPDKRNVEDMGVRATLACPIPGDDGAWGVIGPVARTAHAWTEDDVAFVESVAATIGAAVRRQQLEDQLRHQALHDPLTGLPHRALVTDRIEHALQRSRRGDSSIAVLLLDLDDFKTVNDSLGHLSGDRLLAELAVRFGRVVGEGDTVARLGGDEFVVVCEDVGGEQDVAFVAEALLGACATGVEVAGHRLEVSASVGVALVRDGDTTASALLSEADIAMYRAKRDRPGTYRTFDEAMRGDAIGRLNLAGELRAAVRSGAIDVAFQPIVDLRNGQVTAMEALARWTNESGEMIPPDVFIPLAEEVGLIGELGSAVLRAATRLAAEWQQHGEIGLRVNASAHELRAHTYVDHVLGTLEESGLSPDRLGIEITESVLVAGDRSTQENLERLRAAGVTLLIDDFGTGYSSMSYLQRFPAVDVLKIDRSFLAEGVPGRAVVEAIVALGRAFGLQVCAEGVENADQYTVLLDLGCHLAQGYLMSRPVRADQCHELLAGWKPFSLPAS
jgi:diguanylate cyclase (GGDEF)-like protein/PAS domain S-box-containing protein